MVERSTRGELRSQRASNRGSIHHHRYMLGPAKHNQDEIVPNVHQSKPIGSIPKRSDQRSKSNRVGPYCEPLQHEGRAAGC